MSGLLDMIGLLPSDAARLGILALIFSAVVLGVYGVSALWSSGTAVRRRMAGDAPIMPKAAGRAEQLSYADEALQAAPLISPIIRRFVPTDMAKISLLRRRLVCAGFHRPSAIAFYYAARIGLAVAFVLLFAIAAPFL